MPPEPRSTIPGLVDPQPLATPPWLESNLFEHPTMLIVVLLALGLGLSLVLSRSRAVWALLATGLAAGGVWGVSRLVETDRERVAALTPGLLTAAASVDLAALDALLDERLTLRYFRAGGGLDKAGTLRAVREELGTRFRVREALVQELQLEQTAPDQMRTQVRVRVTPEASGFPNISWWSIDWRLDAGRWRAVAIRPLSIQFFNADPGGG